MNHVSERSEPLAAYTELKLGTHVDLSQAQQVQAVPDFVAPTVPSESSAPLPSMYWLLFDMELDSVVDRERGDVVMKPHVTPTPISFFAKWEDMLALERRTRSSAHNAKLVQSKRIRAAHAVEPNRTRQHSGTGQGGSFRCSLPFFSVFFLLLSCGELMYGSKQIASIVVQVAGAEWMSSASLRPDQFSVEHFGGQSYFHPGFE